MKIKNLRWTTLLGTIVLTLLLTIGFGSTPLQASTVVVTVSDLSTTNVREKSLTVSWVTDTSSTGEVHYSTSTDNLDQVAQDTRGASTSDDTHFVTLSTLTADTTYYFDIHSNGEVDNNNGNHYIITTGPTLGLQGPDTVYGQVFKSDGSTPAEGCIVTITLQDNDGAGSPGEAAPLSSLTDQDGYWHVNLTASRVTDLTEYFQYSASGDDIQLAAQCASDGTAAQTVDTGNAYPAAALTLEIPTEPDLQYFYLPLTVRGN